MCFVSSKPLVHPRAAAVRRRVDAVAPRRRLPVLGLARADPHEIRVRLVDGHVADRTRRLVVEQRRPRGAVVLGLPQPAGRGPEIEDLRLRLDDVEVGDAPPHERRARSPGTRGARSRSRARIARRRARGQPRHRAGERRRRTQASGLSSWHCLEIGEVADVHPEYCAPPRPTQGDREFYVSKNIKNMFAMALKTCLQAAMLRPTAVPPCRTQRRSVEPLGAGDMRGMEPRLEGDRAGAAKYRPRVADRELEQCLRAAGAVLIEGPRACGKTATAQQMAGSEVFLDVDRVAQDMMVVNPNLVLEGATPRLIDEWQTAPVIWNHIRRAVDARPGKGHFILTGSAVPPDDITRHTGAGRIVRLRLRPMSLFELGRSTGRVSLARVLGGAPPESPATDMSVRELAELVCVGGWPGASTFSARGRDAREPELRGRHLPHRSRTSGRSAARPGTSAPLHALAGSKRLDPGIPRDDRARRCRPGRATDDGSHGALLPDRPRTPHGRGGPAGVGLSHEVARADSSAPEAAVRGSVHRHRGARRGT